MSLPDTVSALKAAAEPSRLRLLALLSDGEATVGELQSVLDQSQPRVSRHLRLLCEAGLTTRFRDGHSVYYRLNEAGPGRRLADFVIAGMLGDDPDMATDRQRLTRVRRERARHAWGHPTALDQSVMGQVGLAGEEGELAEALLDLLGNDLGDLLDIGTGTGTMLRLLGPRAHSAVGLDTSDAMRLVARTRLRDAGLEHCTIRYGDMHDLPLADHRFDTVVMSQVLSLSDDPVRALEEAHRVHRQGGRLLIMDRLRPVTRDVRAMVSGPEISEARLSSLLAQANYRLKEKRWLPGRAPGLALVVARPNAIASRTGTHG